MLQVGPVGGELEHAEYLDAWRLLGASASQYCQGSRFYDSSHSTGMFLYHALVLSQWLGT